MTNVDIDDYEPLKKLQSAISPVSSHLLGRTDEQQWLLPWRILIVRYRINQQPLYLATSSHRGLMSPIMPLAKKVKV